MAAGASVVSPSLHPIIQTLRPRGISPLLLSHLPLDCSSDTGHTLAQARNTHTLDGDSGGTLVGFESWTWMDQPLKSPCYFGISITTGFR